LQLCSILEKKKEKRGVGKGMKTQLCRNPCAKEKKNKKKKKRKIGGLTTEAIDDHAAFCTPVEGGEGGEKKRVGQEEKKAVTYATEWKKRKGRKS